MPQVDPGAHDPRPVLHRRGHAVRGLRLRLAAAAALHREHLVLGRHRLHRRDVDDLPALDRGDRRASSGTSRSSRTCAGRCFTVLSGWSVSSIVAPGWPFGLPGLRPDLPRSDFGDGFARPSDDGGFDGVPRVRLHLRGQVRDLRLQHGQLLAQHRDLRGLLRDPRVPLGQQLPQPRVRSTKPAITAVGNAGHLGHGRTLPRLRPARK